MATTPPASPLLGTGLEYLSYRDDKTTRPTRGGERATFPGSVRLPLGRGLEWRGSRCHDPWPVDEGRRAVLGGTSARNHDQLVGQDRQVRAWRPTVERGAPLLDAPRRQSGSRRDLRGGELADVRAAQGLPSRRGEPHPRDCAAPRRVIAVITSLERSRGRAESSSGWGSSRGRGAALPLDGGRAKRVRIATHSGVGKGSGDQRS